jgi:hypothetical protein
MYGKVLLAHAMKAYGGSGGIPPLFPISALDGGEWSTPNPTPPLLPAGKKLDTHQTGGWVHPRAGLDILEKRDISCPYRNSDPGPYKA